MFIALVLHTVLDVVGRRGRSSVRPFFIHSLGLNSFSMSHNRLFVLETPTLGSNLGHVWQLPKNRTVLPRFESRVACEVLLPLNEMLMRPNG